MFIISQGYFQGVGLVLSLKYCDTEITHNHPLFISKATYHSTGHAETFGASYYCNALCFQWNGKAAYFVRINKV